jgi:hypothetical protein
MEKSNYQSDYDRSLSTLEDIQLLSEFSMSPLIGRAYYHLSEMKRKADLAGVEQTAHYHKITSVLDEKLESIFTDFFSNKSKFKSFEYHKSVSKIDLKKWNLLLEIIPEVLSVVSLFNYHGPVETRMDENRLIFSGMILEDGHVQMNRKFIYIVTRKLLRQKVLLTFNLKKTGRAGHLKLELRVDISHDDSLVYKVNFKPSQKENYLVGFSNVFCHYRTLQSEAKAAGEHHIVELASDTSLKHYFGILDLNPLESANKEILHFPFLFRPVSIILPMKGNLSKDSFSRNLVSNHDDENKREQNVSTYYRTIDFFSLFNI